MSFYDAHIARLRAGETIQFRPKGNSMLPRIQSGNLVTIAPVIAADVHPGDVVLCRVSGNVYVHLVIAKNADGRFQIGNNRGRINGWTKAIYGKCVRVEP